MTQMNLFEDDTFGMFDDFSEGAAESELIPKEKKKTVKKEKPKAKATKTKVTSSKLVAPVTVVGTDWKFVVEGSGEMEAKDVARAAFNAGYTEVALAKLSFGASRQVMYVNPFAAHETDDDKAVTFKNDTIEVVLGMQKVSFNVSDFGGAAEDVSVQDVIDKFTELKPHFEGCYLAVTEGYAVPVLEEVETLPEQMNVYQDGNTVLMTKAEYEAAYTATEEKVSLMTYESDNDTYFPAYTGEVLVVPVDTYGLKSPIPKTVEEKYKLPFTICLENFNKSFTANAENFGGKEVVTKEDVLAVLKRQYKVFGQSNRKIDVIYEKKANLLSIAVTSGKKGAADVVAFPGISMDEEMRVEQTDIGTFYGNLDRVGGVMSLSFDYKLPLMPRSILDGIIKEFKKDTTKEAMLQVRYNKASKRFYVYRPEADLSSVSVNYRLGHTKDLTVLTIHSHNTMPAYFSSTDDEDEIMTGLYGVVGRLNRPHPQVLFRAGMEGAFCALTESDLFEIEGGYAA